MKISYKTLTTITLTAVVVLGIEHGLEYAYKHFRKSPSEQSISVCFTPGADCTSEIVRAIGSARREVLVQAYGFTSEPILEALARAHQRNVSVRVILDKSNANDERYQGDEYLRPLGVEVYIDHRVAIAHNKIIIIDGHHVVGGSFNYTPSAQRRNAENVTFIWNDSSVAALFTRNWEARRLVSRRLE